MALCLASETAELRQTFGCSEYTVAPCLCGDPSSSARVWEQVTDCFNDYYFTDAAIQLVSGSQLWNSYCEANLKTPATRTIVEPIKVEGMYAPFTSYLPRLTSRWRLDVCMICY